MPAAYELPLISQAQTLSIALAGTTYKLALHWCVASDCWVLDISAVEGTRLVFGIAVVTGCDLLAQYAYLNIKGGLVALTEGNFDAVPTFTNLGGEGKLYFLPD